MALGFYKNPDPLSRKDKAREKILSGTSDASIRFDDLCTFLTGLGFSCRPGGHHIFYKEGVNEIINLQPLPDGKAKKYQVRQVRNIVIAYSLK